MSEPLSPTTALIYIMVAMSAVDRRMSDRELKTIGTLVETLPVFAGFDVNRLVPTAEACARALAGAKGLDEVMTQIRTALTGSLNETGYALAVEVAAADGRAGEEELRLLELMRERLHVDDLVAAAIERAARARYGSGA